MIYQYTNKNKTTTTIYVWEMTEKSVYYIWCNDFINPSSDTRLRMSKNSFSKYYKLE